MLSCTLGCSDNYTPEEQAALAVKAEERKRKNVAFQKMLMMARAIKSSLHDPDSVVWEEIRGADDASVICIQYRARNGFGAMRRSYAAFANGKISDKSSVWKKHCAQALPVREDVVYAATNWK